MTVRRIFTKVLIVFLAFIVIVLAVRTALNYTTGRALEKHIAKAKADGVALKMKDFVPDCPPADNGAQLWKAAESLLQLEPRERSVLSDAVLSMTTGKSIDEDTKGSVAGMIERNRKMLDLMLDAGAKPCFVYKDWSEPAYAGRMINALAAITGTKLLAMDVILRAERGDMPGTLDECRRGMVFIRKAQGDAPYLISGLVAVADMKMLLNAFSRAVSGREIDPAELAAWINDLDPLPWRKQFARWVPGERALMLETGIAAVSGVPDALQGITELHGLKNRAYYWLIRPILKSEIVWVQERYAKFQGLAAAPYFQVRDALIEQEKESQDTPWYYKAVGGLIPNAHAAIMKEGALEALMQATRAGLACKIYKARTGRYPEDLEALVPDILTEVPVDPFTGKPLVFKIERGQLLIYSLGSNQKDDGGRSSPMTQMTMEKDDDWAWRERID